VIISEVALGANLIGTIEDEFEPASVGEGRGTDVLVGSGTGVSVCVGETTTSVEVENAEVGEGKGIGTVVWGCSTFTWNEQALVNNKTSKIQILFMGWLFYLYRPGLTAIDCLV
jgi:hypothetical protein